MDDKLQTVVNQMIDDNSEVLYKLAQDPTSFHPVYYCPTCQEIVTEVYTDDTVTGIWPKCTNCNSLLQWHYERDE